MHFDTVIPECGPASQLAINLMQFLENGLFDYHDDISDVETCPAQGEDMSGTDAQAEGLTAPDDQMLPPHAPRPRLSTAAMSSTADPLLPARPNRQVEPPARPASTTTPTHEAEDDMPPQRASNALNDTMAIPTAGGASPTRPTAPVCDVPHEPMEDANAKDTTPTRASRKSKGSQGSTSATTSPAKRSRTTTSTTQSGQKPLRHFFGDS